MTEYKVMIKGKDKYKCHTTTYNKEDAERIAERLEKVYGHKVRIDKKEI